MPAYLKFDGIDGEAMSSKGHEKWIEIQGWDWGVSQTSHGAGGGGGTGKAVAQDFNFSHNFDKASPKLFLACATGKLIPAVQLDVVRAGEQGEQRQAFLKYKFYDILISSIQPGGASPAPDMPMEEVAFKYWKIEINYFTQDAAGGPGELEMAAFDFKKNVKI